jgi:hypothetical protein
LGAGGRKSLLLFTQQARAEEFAQAHASMVSGLCGLRLWASRGAQRFDGADSVVFNALTRYEYELPAEDFDLLSKAVPRAVADQQ